MGLREEVIEFARTTRDAARAIGRASAETRSSALRAIAAALEEHRDEILEANAKDVADANASGLGDAMTSRLELAGGRFTRAVGLVNQMAETPDVLGRVESTSIAPNGLEVSRQRIPIGVVAMIYESRPNVTTDVAACCIRSGNGAILRGGKESFRSNHALGKAVSQGLEAAGLPADAVRVMPWLEHEAVAHLLNCDETIDVVIPRGGERLIRAVSESSRIPVLKHYKGVCHVYVHAAADLDKAVAICENSKVKPFTCHAAETFLIDAAIADQFVDRVCTRMSESGVAVRGDQRVVDLARSAGVDAELATSEDWGTEYLDRIVSIRVVADLGEAISHIERFGSDHTESIVTEDAESADRFLREVDSSTVFVNASTRLAELPELGLGPELGTSTTRLHAYGPMGALDLTTTKFVVRGSGQLKI